MSKILKKNQIKMVNPLQVRDEEEQTGEDSGISRRLAEGIILEAEFNAQEINKIALMEAKAIKEQAQSKIQEAVAEQEKLGFQKGYNAGLERGQEEGVAHWLALIKNTEEGLLEFDKKLLRWQETLSLEVMELSKEIAKRIVGAELEINPAVIMQRIKSAIKQIVNVKEMIIKVAPADLAQIEEAKESLIDLAGGLTHLRILGTEDLKRGDFVLETDMGGVDGRVDTQLELIRKELVERWQEGGGA